MIMPVSDGVADINAKLCVELMEWLKDDSKRTDQPMAKIIKEPLESLRRKETKAQRRWEQEAKND